MSVYFITGGDESLVKIGFTVGSPSTRLRQLQIGSPAKLRVVNDMPGTVEDERRLHHRFSLAREHGEWFRVTPELESVIFAQTLPRPEAAAALGVSVDTFDQHVRPHLFRVVTLGRRTAYAISVLERYLRDHSIVPSDGDATT